MQVFDVLVVGAGFSGCVAAYLCAKAGLSVALVEGGQIIEKYCCGGVTYTNVLERIFPNFESARGLERYISNKRYVLLSKDTTLTFAIESEKWKKFPYNSMWSVTRQSFESWMIQKGIEAGVSYIPNTIVLRLSEENGFVNGVITEEEDFIPAKITVVATGANTSLLKLSSMDLGYQKGSYLIGVREVLSLDRGVVEERFQLEKREGSHLLFYGEPMKGLAGSGYLVTNDSSVVLGVGLNILSLKAEQRNAPFEILSSLKRHPFIKRLIQGARTEAQYFFITVEKGVTTFSHLYRDGALVVGDAGGFINANLYTQGTLLATLSAEKASEVIIEAISEGDWSARKLGEYAERLEETYAFQDLKRLSFVPYFADGSEDFFLYYPSLAVDLAKEYFTNDDSPRDRRQKKIFTRVRDELSIFPFIKDIWQHKGIL